MGIIVGVDIGGSTTKIVGIKDHDILSSLMVKAGDPLTSAYGAFGRFLSENQLSLDHVDKVMFTGVGSSFLSDGIYGLPTQKVDEFMAIGLGGHKLSGCNRAIVVSMGTGTAFITVDNGEISHYGGTGVGGGTMLGLSERILGIRTFEHIAQLAETGDLSRVDLTVGDISQIRLSNMDTDTTASNFGRLSDVATKADLALGIINLVFQTVGMFAVFAARAKHIHDIVVTGNLSTLPTGKMIFLDLERLCDQKFIVPDNADFATAIGAAIYGQNDKEGKRC